MFTSPHLCFLAGKNSKQHLMNFLQHLASACLAYFVKKFNVTAFQVFHLHFQHIRQN